MADWLQDQLDLGVDDACKDDQRIHNVSWGTGWERQRDIHRAGAGCGSDPASWPRKRTTTWTHFDNGSLRHLETVNAAGTVLESHDVAYFDGAGIYVNGKRTRDHYVLRRGQGSSATTCLTAATALPTAPAGPITSACKINLSTITGIHPRTPRGPTLTTAVWNSGCVRRPMVGGDERGAGQGVHLLCLVQERLWASRAGRRTRWSGVLRSTRACGRRSTGPAGRVDIRIDSPRSSPIDTHTCLRCPSAATSASTCRRPSTPAAHDHSEPLRHRHQRVSRVGENHRSVHQAPRRHTCQSPRSTVVVGDQADITRRGCRLASTNSPA